MRLRQLVLLLFPVFLLHIATADDVARGPGHNMPLDDFTTLQLATGESSFDVVNTRECNIIKVPLTMDIYVYATEEETNDVDITGIGLP